MRTSRCKHVTLPNVHVLACPLTTPSPASAAAKPPHPRTIAVVIACHVQRGAPRAFGG